jgi:integrase
MFTGENEGVRNFRTDFAQFSPQSQSHNVKFPKIIRHRKAEVTIYGKRECYPFYRIAYRVNGQRRMQSFATYGEAKAEAEKKARELSQGSQSLALTAKEITAALSIRDALEGYYRDTGRTVTALQAVTGYLDAMKLLPANQNLGEAVRGYLGTVAVVQRIDLAKAAAEFCEARRAQTVAPPGKRPALSPVYVQDTERQLTEFAGAFPGTAVADLAKTHIDAYIAAHEKLSPKSRNHLRATVRMFLKWCGRRDYLPTNHRLLEADGLRKEALEDAAIDFYRPNELSALLENCDGSMRAIIALQALGGLRLQEALRLTWQEVFGIPGHIEVTSAKSKTRQRRLVEVCPSLADWLEPYRGTEGKVTGQTLDAHTWSFLQLRKSLKIPPRKNGLRHGFVSFHYALHGNENMTAAQAGTSPQMLHAHYRGLATKAEAIKWFSVCPAKNRAEVIPLPLEVGA